MVASEDFFRNQNAETSFFDEGPRVLTAKPNASLTRYQNTSSISTIAIDGYRQGVEITQLKYFDAGLVKIHAGEPGHVLRKNRYGMDKNFRNEPVFEELDYFNPIRFLEAQEHASPMLLNIITFPIITGDNDQIENYVFDGIIEPLVIREVASFFTIEVPFQAHSVKGALMGANSDQTWASDRILTVDYFEPEKHQIEFVDMIDMIGISGSVQIPMNGFFRPSKSTRRPFDDARYIRNTSSSNSYDSSFNAALSLMSGSTDNYISFKEKSGTSGWTYENNPIGTDSIAFGGLTY